MRSPLFPRPGKTARNERRKALATTLNALSVAVLVAAVVQPFLGHHFDRLNTSAAVAVFLLAQLVLHLLLGRLED